MIWSAAVLGFMGSIHCLAMCGPLVVAVNARKQQNLKDKALYNAGRIFTYCLMGVLAGVFGSGIKWAAGQQVLSILTGALLVGGLLISWIGNNDNGNLAARFTAKIKLRLSSLLKSQKPGMWWFGMFNGMLPCGLTYVALAAAVSLGSLPEAILYMAVFGIGTSPMMWSVVSLFQRLKIRSIGGNRLVAGFTWFLAFLLIVRGLGLDVPYLSPDPSNPHRHEVHQEHHQH